MDQEIADVGIVGAGFAGLAAALTLRRHRWSTVLFDGGPPRNAFAAEVHGYLGVPGASATELKLRGREQVRGVGGQIIETRVVDAWRDAEAGTFCLVGEDGRQWPVRRLLLATGLRDVYPDIDSFFDFFGRSVHTCAHCDAYEVRDRPVAVVSWSELTLPFVLELSQWTRQISVVTDGRSRELTSDQRSQLDQRGIPVITQTVRRFEGCDGQLTALRFVDGSTLPVAAAFFNIAHEYQVGLAQRLGCAISEAGCLQVDADLRTTVEHAWAAGDITGQEQLVPVATAQGVKAAVAIHRSLVETG